MRFPEVYFSYSISTLHATNIEEESYKKEIYLTSVLLQGGRTMKLMTKWSMINRVTAFVNYANILTDNVRTLFDIVKCIPNFSTFTGKFRLSLYPKYLLMFGIYVGLEKELCFPWTLKILQHYSWYETVFKNQIYQLLMY